MKEFQAAYLPIGVPTFHLESAQAEFEASVHTLKEITEQVVCPDEMLLSLEKLDAFLDRLHPDLLILQNITFANAAYASQVLKRFSCPILLWTLREPVIDGGRLRLNSLTGAYSAANAIKEFREEEIEYVFGFPTEEEVRRTLNACIRAARMKKQLTQLKMASIGHTPQGFGFGRALDLDLMKRFGVTLDSLEARELIEKAKTYSVEECRPYLEKASRCMKGLSEIPKERVEDFARLYKAYQEYVEENGIGAVSSRCWPDFFTAFGTPVCAVLAMLNDTGTAAACEADAYGALSMYLGMELTKKPVFFGDPVSMDETENTITYWHCGTAACSLAREDTGACVGVHCNRKIGPTLEFGCRPGEEITVFRVGRKPNGSFRFFLLKGKAPDKPKQFFGTSLVVQTETDAKQAVYQSVKDGWEPHFAVIYGDVVPELEMLAHMLGMEVCRY